MAYDFDIIARNYDRMNRLMTLGLDRRWRKLAAQALRLHDTSMQARRLRTRVLDVACGTGDMVVELTKQGCNVTGVDISEEMLEIAKRKTASANFQFSIFNFQFANAEALPFPDATFDAVTCAFGVRNFVHLERGLAEMMRVLKTGGVMIILELATPDNKLVRPFYNLYTKVIIPWLGKRIAGNREAYTYLPTSIERFPKGVDFLRIVEKTGYEFSSDWRNLSFGVCRLYRIQKLNMVKNNTPL